MMLSPRLMSSPQMITVRRVSSQSKLNKRATNSLFVSLLVFIALLLVYHVSLHTRNPEIVLVEQQRSLQYITPKNSVRVNAKRNDDSYQVIMQRIKLYRDYLEDLDGDVGSYPWNAHMRTILNEDGSDGDPVEPKDLQKLIETEEELVKEVERLQSETAEHQLQEHDDLPKKHIDAPSEHSEEDEESHDKPQKTEDSPETSN